MKNIISYVKILIAFIFIGALIYHPGIQGDFLWDDIFIIENNQFIKTFNLESIKNIFTTDYGAGAGHTYHFYRPLENFTHLIEYQLFKESATGYHLFSVLIHAFVAIMIYKVSLITLNISCQSSKESEVISEKGLKIIAFFPALLFLVHPLHSEAVAYISGRSDLLSAFFLILGLYLYIIRKSLPLIIIVQLLAMLSKENGFLLPFLLVLYELSFGKKLNFKKLSVPFGMSFIYLAVRLYIMMGQSSLHSDVFSRLLSRIPGFFVSITEYFRLFFIPVNLHADYGSYTFQFNDLKVIIGIIISLILITGAIYYKKKNPLFFISVIWFFIALLPSSNLFSLSYEITFFMAEHWLYTPSFLLFIFFPFFIYKILIKYKLKKSFKWIMIFLAVALGSMTYNHSKVWSSAESFYLNNITQNPESSLMHYNLANLYREKKQYKDAVNYYRKSIALNTKTPGAYINLAGIYLAAGRKDLAENLLKEAILKLSDSEELNYNLGLVLAENGKTEEALIYFQNASTINPLNFDSLTQTAIIFSSLDKREQALEYFNKANLAQINNPDGYINLAIYYLQEKNIQKAKEYYDKALDLGGNNEFLSGIFNP